MNYNKLAVRNLIRNKARSIALALIVLFMSFLMFAGSFAVTGMSNGLKSLEARMGADVIVIPQEAAAKVDLKSMLLQGTQSYFYMDRAYLDQVAQIDGIEKISPQYFLVSISAGCCSVPAQIIGIDESTDFTVAPWIRQSYGKPLEPLDVVVGSQINGSVGSTVRFYDVDCRVVAKLETTGTGMDTAVYCNTDTIKTLIDASVRNGTNILAGNDPEKIISAIYIKVKDGVNPDDVRNDINIHVRHVTAESTKDMISGVGDSLSGVSAVIRALIIIVWILAMIILVITFTMLINERKKEFAILRVAGASRAMLSRMMLKEAFIISAIGGILGLIAGAVTVLPVMSFIEDSMGLPYLSPSPAAIGIMIAVTLGIAFAAGPAAAAYSAFRLSRVDAGRVLKEGN